MEACNKTHCVRSNTFSPCNRCMRTKSGSCVEVSFSILNRFLLLTLSFNSLGLSGDDPLISLTTTLPGLSLAPILNDLVEFETMIRLSILPIIPSKLASSV